MNDWNFHVINKNAIVRFSETKNKNSYGFSDNCVLQENYAIWCGEGVQN